MAGVIGKRKREAGEGKIVQFKKHAAEPAPVNGSKPKAHPRPPATKSDHVEAQGSAALGTVDPRENDIVVQIVVGSYERVLHGISATIPRTTLFQPEHLPNKHSGDENHDHQQRSNGDVAPTFVDSFLFTAHTSAIRCLALSPPTEADKRILATGSSDERVNLYSLSTAPPKRTSTSTSLPLLTSTATSENIRNKAIGNLLHHDRAITCLQFPTKSKLFSAAEDNTIAISRTRDWTVLSSIKAPIPKPFGRPSGDTAAPGEVPAGINDFAIHPSQKLMLSVSRGEKCMRLWNLMTGKKAGVLSFERELLMRVGEGKHSTGEGRRVLWDANGMVYVVGFERGAAVFGLDSKAIAVLEAAPRTKFHQMRFLPAREDGLSILVASTEDGRLIFFEIAASDEPGESPKPEALPLCRCIAQLGGLHAGINGRIKDFDILQIPSSTPAGATSILIVTGSSDGAVRLWDISQIDIPREDGLVGSSAPPPQVGRLLGIVDTGNRVTCMTAFLLDGKMSTDDTEVHGISQVVQGVEESESESEG